MEKSIRVLVANHPRLMREIILTTFADQPDIEIVGEVEDESEISASVKKTLPDFVVVALDQPGIRPRICDALLREHPEVRVIAVAPKKNFIVYYWADRKSTRLNSSHSSISYAVFCLKKKKK